MSPRPHVPARTCVACRCVREKGELVRIVRRADGSVVIDPGAREQGRGAYVCRNAECIARAPSQLPRALRSRRGDRVMLEQELASMGDR